MGDNYRNILDDLIIEIRGVLSEGYKAKTALRLIKGSFAEANHRKVTLDNKEKYYG